jgi:uncharacterized membrane protein AbrB (regulator of aidB expression)
VRIAHIELATSIGALSTFELPGWWDDIDVGFFGALIGTRILYLA